MVVVAQLHKRWSLSAGRSGAPMDRAGLEGELATQHLAIENSCSSCSPFADPRVYKKFPAQEWKLHGLWIDRHGEGAGEGEERGAAAGRQALHHRRLSRAASL